MALMVVENQLRHEAYAKIQRLHDKGITEPGIILNKLYAVRKSGAIKMAMKLGGIKPEDFDRMMREELENYKKEQTK